MAGHSVIVIGASAGGVDALTVLASMLPKHLPAAVFVVLHLPALSNSVLPRLMSRAKRLPAAHARDGEAIEPGRIYVAPPDQHMLLGPREVRLARGPAENGHRPAIDPLFRSAARWHDSEVIGVVLSGSLDDGTAGLSAIHMAGGITVVQDPGEALYPSMPQSALDHVAIDHVAPIGTMADLLTKLVAQSPNEIQEKAMDERERLEAETEAAGGNEAALEALRRRGAPSGFACPDCHGVLWELKEGELMRYRCRVGHAYLPQSLSAAQSERVEEALWIALRALRESSALSNRLATRAQGKGIERVVASYIQRANDADERARVIEDVLKKGRLNSDYPVDPEAGAGTSPEAQLHDPAASDPGPPDRGP